jgi:ubiquitin-conjugating enzyme E2 D/E
MSKLNTKRIMHDLTLLENHDIPDTIGNVRINDNICGPHDVEFIGPPDTPYEKGHFHITIILPSNYPFEPPTLQFKTKIKHPNINNGNVCLDILKNKWTPSYSFIQVFLSLSALLQTPNPDSPLDANIADIYIRDTNNYKKTVKEYVEKHAQTILNFS